MFKGIGLGLAALGRPGYINLGHAEDLDADYDVAAMEARAHAVLDAAYDGGVRYFDAARSYGRAEPFLASWLNRRGLAAGDVSVGSKWGYRYTAEWRVQAEAHEIKDHSLAHFSTQIEETRANLGSFLSLYQIHSATLDTGVLEDRDVLAALARLKSDGVRIGFSTSGPRQPETIERGLAATVDGVRVFDAVQSTYNLLERSAGEALAAASDTGLTVIVKEAVANGRLTARGNITKLNAAATAKDTTPDALAIAFVLSQPFVDVVLSGAATVEHLASNLAAAKLEDTDVDVDVEAPDDYWARRKALAWN